jgi:succinyl-CoA synthetase beta subunit
MDAIERAVQDGRAILTEYETKRVLAEYGAPVVREALVEGEDDLAGALETIGFPVALKGAAPGAAHKTEAGLIRTGVRSMAEAAEAFEDIWSRMEGDGRAVLVQEMVPGQRELMAGLIRDERFGPTVCFGLGGIFAEVLGDVVFRVAPLSASDALGMLTDIRAAQILGPVRGLPEADLDALADLLATLGRIGLDRPQVMEIDINPIILHGASPVIVDALMVLSGEPK